MAHRLGGEIDERRGPQRGSRPAGHGGIAVVGVAQCPVDAGVEDGLDQVGVMWASQPSSRSQPSNVRERCRRLTPRLAGVCGARAAVGVGGRLEPVPADRRNASAFSVSACRA